jgi:hypothetical protein
MAVPAQPSSSSASAQQSGSSSSGQAPTFAHDSRRPCPSASNILTQIQGLQSQVAEDLNPAITQAASAAATWTQAVTNDKDMLTALDTAIAAMLKGSSSDSDKTQKDASPDPGLVQKGASPDPKLQKLENKRDEVANRLTSESGPAAQRPRRRTS